MATSRSRSFRLAMPTDVDHNSDMIVLQLDNRVRGGTRATIVHTSFFAYSLPREVEPLKVTQEDVVCCAWNTLLCEVICRYCSTLCLCFEVARGRR